MEIRKVYKDGGSKVIPIPTPYLTNLGLSIGDRVCIVLTNDRKLLISKLDIPKGGKPS